jgi:hypothetical protein
VERGEGEEERGWGECKNKKKERMKRENNGDDNDVREKDRVREERERFGSKVGVRWTVPFVLKSGKNERRWKNGRAPALMSLLFTGRPLSGDKACRK